MELGHSQERELRALMTASLDGDAGAYRMLLERLTGHLRAYYRNRFARIGHGPAEAEDLLQEVLIAIHTHRDTPMEATQELISSSDMAAVESGLDLQRLMSRISSKAREAIQYIKLEVLTVSEAAARSGMSESAIKVAVHRAFKALALKIREENGT